MPAKSRDERILALLERRGVISTADAARTLRISRQAAHRRLRALADRGEVLHQGAGRGARWVLPAASHLEFDFPTAGLAEDRVWTLLLGKVPALASLPADARAIATYAFTEMLNNALEHSGSDRVHIDVAHDARSVCFEIDDAGIGAFEHVRRGLGLDSELDALAELSKGKTTTAPEAHTGEGVFFTSRAVERFELEANGVEWIVDNSIGDFTVRSTDRATGTRVRCIVPLSPKRTLSDVFMEYAEDGEFSRTRAVVRLFALGSEFVSRSHARRLLHGLERFREVIVDFDRIEAIGQGFADEVFRVWPRAHPGTRIVADNAVPAVDFMIRRALAAAEQDPRAR